MNTIFRRDHCILVKDVGSRPTRLGWAQLIFQIHRLGNRYAYVGNNPTGMVDPLGLQVRQIECVGCNLNGALDCNLSFSCVVFTDSFGMQIDSRVAIQQLHNGSGVICQQCAGHPNWVVGANNDIYDVEAYQRFGSTYDLSKGIASPPAFLGWLLNFGKVGHVNEDTHPGLGAFYNSSQCPSCGNIMRNTAGAVNTAFVATGVVAALPVAAAAAPYVPAILDTGLTLSGTLLYNPATWVAAEDIINVLTPPVYLPRTWPGFGVCIAARCWDPNP